MKLYCVYFEMVRLRGIFASREKAFQYISIYYPTFPKGEGWMEYKPNEWSLRKPHNKYRDRFYYVKIDESWVLDKGLDGKK